MGRTVSFWDTNKQDDEQEIRDNEQEIQGNEREIEEYLEKSSGPIESSPNIDKIPSGAVGLGTPLLVPMQLLGIVVGYVHDPGKGWFARIYMPALKKEGPLIPIVIKPEMGIKVVPPDLLGPQQEGKLGEFAP